ncbi:MAG: HAD family phosphatase [Bacteroidales bacterium]|nr:HAD family phosphatase [Bacteroidales bacterium]
MIDSYKEKSYPQINAVFLDLDGTLLSSELEVSAYNKRTLGMVRERGVHIFLASGRPTAALAKLAGSLPIGPYILASNGGCVVNIDSDEILFSQELDKDTVSNILQIAQTCGVSPNIYSPSHWFVEEVNEFTKIEIRRVGIQPAIVSYDSLNTTNTTIIKILLIGDDNSLAKCRHELEMSRLAKISWFHTYPEYLEIMPIDVSKGTARDRLLDYLHIPIRNVLAIGDGINDIPLLADAGVSVAVSNANEELLKIADFITLSNDSDGVSYALKAFILGDQAAFSKLIKTNKGSFLSTGRE